MKHTGLFRPRYRDKRTGQIKETEVWWLRYSCHGCPKHPIGGPHRESSETTKVTQAQVKLASLKGAVADGKPIVSKADRVKLAELFQSVVDDYRNNKKRTLPEVEMRLKLHIRPFFYGRSAQSIRTADIEAYKAKRLGENAAPATVNRELSVIGRAFSLGLEQDRIIIRLCKIKKLRENNTRQGFVTEEQLETLCKFLPQDVEAPVRFAFYSGWRMSSEILSRQWCHVDFESRKVRLEASETKNRRPRVFPFMDHLEEILQNQWTIHQQLLREKRLSCSYVFHHNGGPLIYKDKRGQYKPSSYFRKAWFDACEKAGLAGQIPHDFRRVAVSRFERAGVSRKVGMQLSGHLTESIYSRYDVVREQDLQEAVTKLEGFHKLAIVANSGVKK